MSRTGTRSVLAQHAPQNAMTEAGEIARFYDRSSDLMRELLDALADAPDQPRTFPRIEDAMGWPRRRIASVLGGVSHLRHTEFGGCRPYASWASTSRRRAAGRCGWMATRRARCVLRGAIRRTARLARSVATRPPACRRRAGREPGLVAVELR